MLSCLRWFFTAKINGIVNSLLDILRKTEAFFESKKVESPRLSAELIFAHVMGIRRLDLYLQFDRPLDERVLAKARALVGRRAKNEPLQYIFGKTSFCSLILRCDQRALIPRPETEELVELLSARLKDTPPAHILDLGTGTGAIAIALAKAFPQAEIWAADTSAQALALARENAQANQTQINFVETNWYNGLPEKSFDLIVSNPPYLTETEWAEAHPQVRDYEPKQALTAPASGLADLLHIVKDAFARLKDGGVLALETGIAHYDALAIAATASRLLPELCIQDLNTRPRFFFAKKQ